ncbi:hypothetical protein [Chachezhania sediminis]|uniref:hypothetical protein n=1 Tax=Chachezhania sediminis TaxID=2599291 RepID=UPI00131AC407|nr:hypothetical protein [Chachezhania sediminis]
MSKPQTYTGFTLSLSVEFLTEEGKSFAECYGLCARVSDAHGWPVPDEDGAKLLLIDLIDEKIRLLSQRRRDLIAETGAEPVSPGAVDPDLEAGTGAVMGHSMDDALKAVLKMVCSAECHWEELSKLIAERRRQNVVQGGDDRKLAAAMAFFIRRIPLPFSRETQR